MRTINAPVAANASTSTPYRPASVNAGLAVVVLAVLVHLALCWILRGFITDDAWISVRYAENLGGGEGFVWNPGGPRAEGFSNPLLVALEALAHAAGWSAPGAARLLGVVSGAACVVLVYVMGRPVVGEMAARIGSLLTACSAPFALWAVGGLETLLVAVAVTVGTLELARPDGGRVGRAATAFAVLPWLRPEGLAIAGTVIVLSEAPRVFGRGPRWPALGRALLLGGVLLCSQAVLEVVRLGVYGHLLPNSVIYKSGAGDALTVLSTFLGQALLPTALAVAGAVIVTGRARLLAVPPAVYALGSIGTLDSANAYSRFVMPVWPMIALLAAVVVAPLARLSAQRHGGVSAVAVAAGAALVVLALPPANVWLVHQAQRNYMDCQAGAREAALTWLRGTPPDTSFAISDAGLVPARAEGRLAVDSFFLNEPLIQETGRMPARKRAGLVHDRAPDVLVLASREPGRFVGHYPTDQAIHDHPAMSRYRLAHVARGRSGSCGYHLLVFRR